MEQKIGINLVFVVGDSKTRDGADEDFEKIKTTFEDKYNALVYNWLDCSLKEYRSYFRELKTNQDWLEKFDKCQFVAIFCLAHGTSDGLVRLGEQVANIKTLFLNPLFKIKQLKNKLKWLVVQACRGDLNDDADIEFDNDEEMEIYRKYFIVSYSTGDDTISFQYGESGKIFIQSICKRLCENAVNGYNECLIAMLLKTHKDVAQYGREQSFGKDYSRPEILKNIENYVFQIKSD